MKQVQTSDTGEKRRGCSWDGKYKNSMPQETANLVKLLSSEVKLGPNRCKVKLPGLLRAWGDLMLQAAK